MAGIVKATGALLSLRSLIKVRDMSLAGGIIQNLSPNNTPGMFLMMYRDISIWQGKNFSREDWMNCLLWNCRKIFRGHTTYRGVLAVTGMETNLAIMLLTCIITWDSLGNVSGGYVK